MSEIKGQLLGIVLVVTIFGAVAGVLLSAFNTAAQNTADQISEVPAIEEPTAVGVLTNDLGNLVF